MVTLFFYIYYWWSTQVVEFGIWAVGLDVVRTDRALVFYESESNQAKLWTVLAIYAWMDNDIGYVQGEFL